MIKKASKIVGKECSIFVDLQGATIRSKNFRDNLISIPLKAGQEFRITSNKKLLGNERFVVWDYVNGDKNDKNSLVDKLEVGSTILVDYGQVALKVMGFEDEMEFE